ncbi:MAG TPA: DUF211 domain-containing protein [Gammaproteobacteria bacterium]|nr:DUF211 domain-containing protein [Gammaproteobacteria bacterium]
MSTHQTRLTRLVLDVLKPHRPGALEFARAMAARSPGARVNLSVVEMDERTETMELVVEGQDLDFEQITGVISELGGSLHSIDQVEVVSGSGPARDR